MASVFVPTGAYSNISRLELEQLRRGDYAAGGKALTIGDSGLLPEGVVGKGNVNAESFYTNASLTFSEVTSLTPVSEPGKYLSRNPAQLYDNGWTSFGVTWYGPTSIVNGVESSGFITNPDQFSDSGALFQTDGVLPGDLIIVEVNNGGGYPVGVVGTVDSETAITATNITGGTWASNAAGYYDIVRPSAVQLFAVPGSGPAGQEQTFFFVYPGSTLHDTVGPTADDINSDRILDIVSPRYALDSTIDRADAVYPSPAPHTTTDKLGYRVIFYPDDGTGTGPDLTSPIASLNPVIDPGIPADDQRVTIDYAAGVVRFSCAPAIGGQIKVTGGVNVTTGRLNLYAVFWAVEKVDSARAASQLLILQDGTSQKVPPARLYFNGTSWQFNLPDGTDELAFPLTGGPGVGGFYLRTNEAVATGRTLVGKMNSPVFTIGDGVQSFGDYSVDTAITQAVAALASSPFKSITIHIKPGTYWLNTTTVTVPAGKELILKGYSKEDCIIRFNTTAEGFNVPANSQIVFENLMISDLNSNAGGIIVNGSIRARNCIFQVVNWQFVNPVPLRKMGYPSAVPPVAIVEDCEFYNHDAIGLYAYQFSFYQDNGESWGYFFNNCSVFGAQFGESLCLVHSSAVAVAGSKISGVHFSKCTLTVQCVSSASATAIGRPSGVMHVDPSGGTELCTLDDVAFDDCNVSSFNWNGLANTVLLHLMPIAWDATTITQRMLIGRIRISGGQWSVPAVRGTDFAPFFLQCFHPIVENVLFVGGGTASNSFGVGPGYCGHGNYTDAQKVALRSVAEIATSATHSQFGWTIAASGAALTAFSIASRSSISSGLTVKDIKFINTHRQAGPSGVIALVGPALSGGPANVDGVFVDNVLAGTASSNVNVVYHYIFIMAGGMGALNRGTRGSFRNISFTAAGNNLSPASLDKWGGGALLCVSPEGPLTIEDFNLQATYINGTDACNMRGIYIDFPWRSGGTGPAGELPLTLRRGFIKGTMHGISTNVSLASTTWGPFMFDQIQIIHNPAAPTVAGTDPQTGIYINVSSNSDILGVVVRHCDVRCFVSSASAYIALAFANILWARGRQNAVLNNRIYIDAGANYPAVNAVYVSSGNASSNPSFHISGNRCMGTFGNFVNAVTNIKLQRTTGIALFSGGLGGDGYYLDCETGHAGASTGNYLYVSGQPMVHNDALLLTP